MALSPFHSYQLNELIPIIEHTALDLQGEPVTAGRKQDGAIMTMAEVSYQNSMIAMYNSGISEMARQLIVVLSKEDDPDG